jgi:hypothetical protein
MALVIPKLVALDSSTLGNLAKDWKTVPSAKRVLDILNGTGLSLFLTWHHIEELINHENEEVYDQRCNFLGHLKFINFLKDGDAIGNVGSRVELAELEIKGLLAAPNIPIPALIEQVRGSLAGFIIGRDLVSHNQIWWDYYRKNLAKDRMKRTAEIASLTHFRQPARSPKFRPDLYRTTFPSREAILQHYKKTAQDLAAQMKTHGDVRVRHNADRLAHELMKESYDEMVAVIKKGGSPRDVVITSYGVDESRLPPNATEDDVAFECIFLQNLRLHARRLLLPFEDIASVAYQDKMPSWIVWREINRLTPRLENAEAGNVNDQNIAAFGPYLDSLQVDKRTKHLVDQCRSKHPLLESLFGRLFTNTNYVKLATILEGIAQKPAVSPI